MPRQQYTVVCCDDNGDSHSLNVYGESVGDAIENAKIALNDETRVYNFSYAVFLGFIAPIWLDGTDVDVR